MNSDDDAPVYDTIGEAYLYSRQPDPRIAALICGALGDSERVVNVGAGTGSYEPARRVVAVEPSRVMIDQRPAGAAPCVQAQAERLPFDDDAFDSSLAVLTTHHWKDAGQGLREMRRVSQRQVVLTWDQNAWLSFWLIRDYLPEIAESEASVAALDAVLAEWPAAQVHIVPIPADCQDGFLAAFWRRPSAYLDSTVRAGISSFARLPEARVLGAMARLRVDLESGEWGDRNADLLRRESLDCGYRLVVEQK